MTIPIRRLTEVDKVWFSGIRVSSDHILMGGKKIERTRAGIYNQIFAYLKESKKEKGKVFLQWLAFRFEVDEVTPEIIIAWENELTMNAKGTIFSLILKQKYKTDGTLEFYAVSGKNTIKFITSTDEEESTMLSMLMKYLKYNPSVRDMCNKAGIDCLLGTGTTAISFKYDFEQALKYNTIETIEDFQVLGNDPKRYALAFYDLNGGDNLADTPAWDSFISQIADPEAVSCLMAWIYSVFKGDNFGRQILWLFGVGNTGKSAIGRSIYKRLERLNVDIVTALETYRNSDKHSSSSYTGKRFTLDADTRNMWMLTNTLVKNLTGQDPIAVRSMHKAKDSEQVYSKLLATSNHRPYIDLTREEQISRLLYIEVDEVLREKAKFEWEANNKGDWDKLLDTEIDDFVAKCEWHYYDRVLPDNKNIRSYGGMANLLDGYGYYVLRDVRIWWKSCYQELPEGGKIEVLTLDALCQDYKRYILPTTKLDATQLRNCKAYMLTMFRGMGVKVLSLPENGKQYIVGFKKKKLKVMPTSKTVVDDVIKSVEEEINAKTSKRLHSQSDFIGGELL